MFTFINALIQHPFLQHAVVGGLLASLACGVIGPFVVVKRIGYIAGGISHTILGGMGIAVFLGFYPMVGALVSSLVAALIIGWVSIQTRYQEDIIISALWSTGMALGIIFINLTPGYSADLMTYLFGNILLIPTHALYITAALDGLILLMVMLFNKQLVAVCFDEEFTKLRGIKVTAYYLLLLCLIALTCVILIQIVGLILVIALLTMPAAIARNHMTNITAMMVVSTLLGSVFTFTGIGVAYHTNLPGGATIILVTAVAFLMSLTVKKK